MAEPIDVCIVVEGCYPFIAGGVSSWLDWLIRSQSHLSFGVVALVADDRQRDIRYEMPSNVRMLDVLCLGPRLRKLGLVQPRIDADELSEVLLGIVRGGDLHALDALSKICARPVGRGVLGHSAPPDLGDLMSSRAAWTAMTACYERLAPSSAFADFFWAWRNLVGGLMAVMTAPVPPARVYHAISTGYAGLFATRAARETDARAVVTEHGIYTNERRIDLVMADWIEDVIETGLSVDDARTDVRDFWIETFEAYARITYEGCARITTLYGANQSFQRALGAREERLEVIPNGIVLERFADLPRGQSKRPTAALIGRVVPIKDIEALISAAAVVRREMPQARILVIGPTDEDSDYFALCLRRVQELGLEEVVEFTGKVNILDYLPQIDVLVLTSISEAQPLVLLEAGAAFIPCVTTDVGSCREIIEGGPDETPNLGIAGRVVPPMDAGAIGRGIVELLGDPEERRRCGEVLRRRVETHFTSQSSAARYNALYEGLMAS